MSDKGWIKSHRSIITSSVWDLSHAAYRVASYLIHVANRKPATWGGMDLDAGDCIRSYRTISEDCRVAKSHAQKIIKRQQHSGTAGGTGPTDHNCLQLGEIPKP